MSIEIFKNKSDLKKKIKIVIPGTTGNWGTKLFPPPKAMEGNWCQSNNQIGDFKGGLVVSLLWPTTIKWIMAARVSLQIRINLAQVLFDVV